MPGWVELSSPVMQRPKKCSGYDWSRVHSNRPINLTGRLGDATLPRIDEATQPDLEEDTQPQSGVEPRAVRERFAKKCPAREYRTGQFTDNTICKLKRLA